MSKAIESQRSSRFESHANVQLKRESKPKQSLGHVTLTDDVQQVGVFEAAVLVLHHAGVVSFI